MEASAFPYGVLLQDFAGVPFLSIEKMGVSLGNQARHELKQTVVLKPEEAWTRAEGAHEAIITRSQFHVVQRLMNEDCRRHQGEDTVRSLSGRVYCGDCGTLAKCVVSCNNGKRYAYYVCPNSYQGGGCAKRRISEKGLESVALFALRLQISAILDIDRSMEEIDALPWEKAKLQKLDAEIAFQKEEIQKNASLKSDAYRDFRIEIIDGDDLTQIRLYRDAPTGQIQIKVAFPDFDSANFAYLSCSCGILRTA